MARKIRRALGYVGLSLILIVNTFSANLLLVNAEEAVQESTDIQEESLQTESLTAEESEQESIDPKQADAADAASKQSAAESDQADAADTAAGQTDEQTPDNTAVEPVNKKTDESASDQKEVTPEAETDKKRDTDTAQKGGKEVDSVEPANASMGRIYFEEESVSYDADILDYDYPETLYLYNDEGILSVESSDVKVAVIDDWSWDYVSLNLKAPGTAQITVIGLEGSTASCTVTVEDPGLVVEEKEKSASISQDDIGFSVTKGCGLTYTSSDPSVVQAYKDTEMDYTGRYCRLEPQKPGKADIIVKDFAGRTETVHVTITDANWSLEQNKINALLSEDYAYIDINNYDEYCTFTAKSSNSKVVSIEDCYSSGVSCLLNNPGTAVITVADQYGKQQTCTITVKPNPISFGKYKTVKYNTYEGYGEKEIFEYDLETDGNSIIKTVTSNNTKVVTVQRKKYDGYEDYYLEVCPVGTGSAVITATDQYNQKATIQVTVTQKYVDEKRFYDDLNGSSYAFSPYYGETQVECYCPIIANVYTIINGKKYTGVLQSDGYYHIKGLPRLSAGTRFKVGFQKGQAVFLDEVTVQKEYGNYLPMTVKAQTYTGKALSPAVTIKHGKTILKKGTDYTVKYTNNKNVGNGKATIVFKGNYTGAKAVTFKINPPKTSLTKTKNGKKDFTVYWKKQAKQTTGYQIQYSTNSQFKKGNKAVTVSKTETTSKKVTGLKRKTTYYVRIRTFKKIGKTTFYSGWSAAKKAKTK